MKKIMLGITLGVVGLQAAQNGIFSSEAELEKEKTEIAIQDNIDAMKKAELEQTKQSIALYEANPLVQSLLLDFLKEIAKSSEGQYRNLLSTYTNELSGTIKTRLTEELDTFRLENEKLQKVLENKHTDSYNALKQLVDGEVDKILVVKKELEKKQLDNEAQMTMLKNMFKEMQDKMDSYTKYIDTKFSLKAVKEIELSRIFLLKEDFPIKYIKNFNNKSKISIVLNNEKEYVINSMITERCRIADISNTHISVECIDINNKLYKNVMELKITDPKDDYILNSIKEQLNFSNKDYQDNRSSSQNNRQKPTNALNKTNFK